ncbi:MAG: hypothetical protein IPO55_13495 [Alphaproteobacteria bacterium]|nr:hypothetical protein [Alphaproteobacteria bacterium]
MKDEAMKVFQENPDNILNIISIYVESENWLMVKNKTEVLLDSKNPDIIKWHDIALEKLNKKKPSKPSISAPPSETEQKTIEETSNNWSMSVSNSPMDDTPLMVIRTESLNTVKTWLDEVRPSLTARVCT